MNTKQSAEETWDQICDLTSKGNGKTADFIAIIQAAIEKATDVEQLRAECDHYKMLTQELGQELRAARASEEK